MTLIEKLRAQRDPYRRLAIIALLGVGLTFVYMMLVIRQFVPPAAVFCVAALASAAALTRGWRWATVVVAALSIALVLAILPPALHMVRNTADPLFPSVLLALSMSMLALVGGVGASIRSYRRAGSEPGSVKWLTAFAVGVGGACLGAIALGTVADASATTGVSPETLATLPALVASDMEFDRSEIRVRVGEVVALRLENEDRMAHSFDIDDLGVHVAMQPGTPALALFRVDRPGTYTFYCAPHYDRKTGRGMKGTFIVEP